MAEAERDRNEELAARLVMERAISFCEQGNDSRGLLLLARSLEMAPADAGDLQQDIRTNLAGWYRQSRPVSRTFQFPVAGRTLVVFSPGGKSVAMTGADQIVRVWKLDSRESAPLSLQHPGPVIALDRKSVV